MEDAKVELIVFFCLKHYILAQDVRKIMGKLGCKCTKRSPLRFYLNLSPIQAIPAIIARIEILVGYTQTGRYVDQPVLLKITFADADGLNTSQDKEQDEDDDFVWVFWHIVLIFYARKFIYYKTYPQKNIYYFVMLYLVHKNLSEKLVIYP